MYRDRDTAIHLSALADLAPAGAANVGLGALRGSSSAPDTRCGTLAPGIDALRADVQVVRDPGDWPACLDKIQNLPPELSRVAAEPLSRFLPILPAGCRVMRAVSRGLLALPSCCHDGQGPVALPGDRASDLLFLVAGAGFEPATSGL